MRVAVGDVLEDVEAEDDVEAGVRKRQPRTVDLGDGQRAEQPAALVDAILADLDALDAVALLQQLPQERATAAADFEHTLSWFQGERLPQEAHVRFVVAELVALLEVLFRP